MSEDKIHIAFNKSLRIFFNYDRVFSAKAMFCENNIDNYDILCRKYIFKFNTRLLSSDHSMIRNIFDCSSIYTSTYFKQILCEIVYLINESSFCMFIL